MLILTRKVGQALAIGHLHVRLVASNEHIVTFEITDVTTGMKTTEHVRYNHFIEFGEIRLTANERGTINQPRIGIDAPKEIKVERIDNREIAKNGSAKKLD